MNYKKIYDNIINYRKENIIADGYYELHHIIPKSLGGSDNVDNIIKLSSREHFICHFLLVKIYEKETFEWYKMNHAFMMMKCSSINHNRYFNSRLYESLRENFSKTLSFSQKGLKNSQFGKVWVTNGVVNKKINKYNEIPKGFYIGRKIKGIYKQKKIKCIEKFVNKQRKIKFVNKYINYYNYYDKYGWNNFVKRYDYKFSKPNFVKICQRNVPNFISQNGKKRGSD